VRQTIRSLPWSGHETSKFLVRKSITFLSRSRKHLKRRPFGASEQKGCVAAHGWLGSAQSAAEGLAASRPRRRRRHRNAPSECRNDDGEPSWCVEAYKAPCLASKRRRQNAMACRSLRAPLLRVETTSTNRLGMSRPTGAPVARRNDVDKPPWRVEAKWDIF